MSEQKSVEVFFDCSSPWTYLAYVRLRALEARAGYAFHWKPILVGGVFNAVNESVYEARANPHPVKGRYYVKDLQDWAKYVGIKIGMPPVFPVRSVEAMRGAFYAEEQGKFHPFILSVFKTYWGDLKDIGDWDVLLSCAKEAGLDPEAFRAAASSDDAKTKLKANTQGLIDRGGFGSPTIFVNSDDMYFGNDRMELIAHTLGL